MQTNRNLFNRNVEQFYSGVKFLTNKNIGKNVVKLCSPLMPVGIILGHEIDKR